MCKFIKKENMKQKYLFCFLVVMCVSSFYSCKEPAEYEDVVYITGTENSSKIKLTIDGPQSIALTATCSEKINQEIDVTFKISPELLEAYNAKMNRNYVMPPAGSYEIDKESVLIKKGSHISDPVKLSITSLKNFKDGESYCIPVSLVSAGGGFSVLESSKTVFVVIEKTIITKAANFTGNDLWVEKFKTDLAVSNIPALTMECRFKINRFSWINSVLGIEENFLMRCVDWDEDGNYNVEMGPITVGGNKLFHAAHSDLTPGKWYHVAIVCTGSKTILYIDGELDSEYGGRTGGINLNEVNNFYLGTSCDARPLNGSMSEARIWKKALTQAEIQDNICYVDPTSEGLLAYWRLDEIQEDGSVLDVTGHGYNAKRRKGTTNLVDGVRCPF